MNVNKYASTEALETDFADEFASLLGGAGQAIVEGHRASGDYLDDEDDEVGSETGASLLGDIQSDDRGDEVRDVDREEAPPEKPAAPTAYSKEDAEALSSLFEAPAAPAEYAVQRELRELREQVARLSSQPAPQRQSAGQAGKIKPTGNPEVDQYLREVGQLDETPSLPPEFVDRLSQLERQQAEAQRRAQADANARALVNDARAKAAQIVKVFKDVDEEAVARMVISASPTEALEFARGIYRKAGLLDTTGLPTGHISDRRRTPMPHARGVGSGRGPAPARDAGGWTPTNDPAERAKRMSRY